jgi:putative SOS response-associated peptidase YedK
VHGKKAVQPVINARAETVAERPFFREAFRKQRCLVLADGFYEWQRTKAGKVPYWIALETQEPFAFAGIWSTVHDAEGTERATYAIITTEPNALVAAIHNQMPVILTREDEADWLNPQLSLTDAQAMLVPFPAELLTTHQVTSKVNSPANNTPDLIEQV